MFPATQIAISIRRAPGEVYTFASDPRNLPQWAAGLAGSTIAPSGEEWIADSPMGTVRIRFAERNRFGVMDHDVTLPSGDTFHNPFRVVRNGEGSEVIFTLYRRPGMTDEELGRDAAQIRKDLATLKSVLER
jgi:hypothetical protein